VSPLKGASEVSVPRAQVPMRIHPVSADVAGRWDEFVTSQSTGTIFHLTGWKNAIEKTFGYRPNYIYSENAGKITGVAPIFEISNWIMGRCLLSIPLAVYGGVCAADHESETALLAHLKDLSHLRDVDFMELRFRKKDSLPGFLPNDRYATFSTTLSPDADSALKHLPRDTRYMIRKATKSGLRSQYGLDQIATFYKLFAYSMRRLGTPVFPRALFDNLIREFEGRCELLVIYLGTEPVTGVLSFYFRDTVLPYYAGASPGAQALAANNFMYWELMKHAASLGMRRFDFGRSKKGTGAYAFKTQWNMNIEPLDYQVYLVRRKDMPNFSPVNPKFGLATRVWRRMPLPLTTWIGPRVVRWFP
jgi:FemAB-related protein (PEP-CTERM system-associated)